MFRFRISLLVFCGILSLAGTARAQTAFPEDPAAISDTHNREQDSQALNPDSLARESVLDSVPLAKKIFNHREQIITGGVIMGCIALIMASINNYNPR